MFPLPLTHSGQAEAATVPDFNVDQIPTGLAQAELNVPACIEIVSSILACQAEIRQAEMELPQLKAQQGQEQRQIRQAMENIRHELHTLEGERGRLETNLGQRRNQVHERIQTLSDQTLKLGAEIQTSTMRQQRLQDEMQSMTSALQVLRSDLARSNADWHALSGQLAEKLAEGQSLGILNGKTVKQLSRLNLEKNLLELFQGCLDRIVDVCSGKAHWLPARRLSNPYLGKLLEQLMPQITDVLLMGSMNPTLTAIDKGGVQAQETIKNFLLQHPKHRFFHSAHLATGLALLLGMLILYDVCRRVLPEHRALEHLNYLKQDLVNTYESLSIKETSGNIAVTVGDHQFEAAFEHGQIKINPEFHAAWNTLLVARGMPGVGDWRFLSDEGFWAREGIMLIATCGAGLVKCAAVMKFGVLEVFGDQADQRVLKGASQAWKKLKAQVRDEFMRRDERLDQPSDFLVSPLRTLTKRKQWSEAALEDLAKEMNRRAVEIQGSVDAIQARIQHNECESESLRVRQNQPLHQKIEQGLSQKISAQVNALNVLEKKLEEEAKRHQNLNDKLRRIDDEISQSDPQLYVLHQALAATKEQILRCERQKATLEFNVNLTLDRQKNELEQVTEQISMASLQVEELKHAHMDSIEERITQIIQRRALNLAFTRHTLLPDSALKARVLSGRFVNAVGETLNKPATAASSFEGYSELLYAVLKSHAHALSLRPSNGLNVRLKLDKPLGRMTSGNAIVVADTVVYSYQTEVDPKTRQDRRVITHIMCESGAGQSSRS